MQEKCSIRRKNRATVRRSGNLTVKRAKATGKKGKKRKCNILAEF
jgi:hypothetical protein